MWNIKGNVQEWGTSGSRLLFNPAGHMTLGKSPFFSELQFQLQQSERIGLNESLLTLTCTYTHTQSTQTCTCINTILSWPSLLSNLNFSQNKTKTNTLCYWSLIGPALRVVPWTWLVFKYIELKEKKTSSLISYFWKFISFPLPWDPLKVNLYTNFPHHFRVDSSVYTGNVYLIYYTLLLQPKYHYFRIRQNDHWVSLKDNNSICGQQVSKRS